MLSQSVEESNAQIPDEVERVKVRFERRTTIFFSVTEAELDIYFQFGLYAGIALFLSGLFGGFATNCLVALIQSNLSQTAQAVFWWLMWFSGFMSIICLVSAITFTLNQQQEKKCWKSIV